MTVKLNGRMQRVVMDQGDCVSFEWMLNIDIDIVSTFKCMSYNISDANANANVLFRVGMRMSSRSLQTACRTLRVQ